MTPLFHYCTVHTFHSIVSSARVRLSSVRHANDATEGTLLSAAVARLARRAHLSEEEASRLQTRAGVLELQFDGMALCLSEDGDLLSQWRGYADDGRGVAIGFNREYIDTLVELSEKSEGEKEQVNLALYQTKYEPDEHDAAVEPLFNLLRSLQPVSPPELAGNEKSQELVKRLEALQALRLSLEAYDQVYSLKHRAFAEEREWRLLHHFDWEHASPDGYHPRKGSLVPYVDLCLSAAILVPIAEVVLGPRHTTPVDVVTRFLEGHGQKGVTVRPSSSPYRRDA